MRLPCTTEIISHLPQATGTMQPELFAPLIGLLRRARYALGTSTHGIGPTTIPRVGCDHRRPPNAVLVIDASYSMDETDWKPSRLDAAIESATAYIERLAAEEPHARVAIVGYWWRARVFSRWVAVSETETLHRALGSISTKGYTNITAGLKAARKLLGSTSGLCQVVLLTDGHHCNGPDPRSIAARLRQVATVECIGIGGRPTDVDEDLLKEIASSHPDGSKRYRWIGNKQRLVEHFQQLAGRITRHT